MIQRIAAIRTNCLAMRQSGIEHQYAPDNGVGGEYGEHGSLIIGLQVKKAVPRQDPVEAPAECHGTHVCMHPLLARHSVPAQRYQTRRGIDPGNLQAVGNHAGANRLAAAATKIQDGRGGRQQTNEPIDPTFVIPGGRTAIRIPRKRMTFVMAGDQVSKVTHEDAISRFCLPKPAPAKPFLNSPRGTRRCPRTTGETPTMVPQRAGNNQTKTELTTRRFERRNQHGYNRRKSA